ncbi:MAG: polyphosphate polymerase domain-containing protein [Bacteroidetes bacterium]|nr:polyphosphate polymerase domain-containing protein [Bacteroidota bacterium]
MRFERKFFSSNFFLPVIEQIIKSHPASFSTIFPDRKVNNIYFDTQGLTTFQENVIGISKRKKFRLRWYGNESFRNSKIRFEIKYKENQTGYKKTKKICENNHSLYSLQKQINKLLHQKLFLQPVLYNHYQRAYFGTKDGKFRITIDSEMQFASLLNRNFEETVRHFIPQQGNVVELKYDLEHDEEAREVMQFLPFRMTKNSKYVTGVQLTTL